MRSDAKGMFLEVHGCNTANKGAELMFVALRDQVARRMPEARLAADVTFGDYAERARHGLFSKLQTYRWGRSRMAFQMIPKPARLAYGLVIEDDISAVVDASGFAFGDQHGADPTKRLATKTARWRAAGKKVVLLPQAFGPFEGAEIRAAIVRAVANCDLVFARDQVSLDELKKAVGDAPNLRLAPDFTTVVRPLTPTASFPSDAVCIVPNTRMLDKAKGDRAAQYVPMLADAIRGCRRRGLPVFLLVHDAGEDIRIAHQIAEAADDEVPIIEEKDPRALKGILGSARLAIASRFHALVGTLSQGVPSIGLGWSHKYEMLFADYGCSDMLLPVEADRAKLNAALDHLADPKSHEAAAAAISKRAFAEKAKVEAMWDEVFTVLAAAK